MYNTEEKCMELSEKLKKICVVKGSTPYKLAKKAGISSSTISGFLKGKTKPRIDTLLIICNQLEISMTDFLDERGRMEKYVKEEEELVTVYRSLSDEKRRQLNIYLKMLGEYNGRIDD